MKPMQTAIVVAALFGAPQIAVGQAVLLRLNPAAGLESKYQADTRVWMVSVAIPQSNSDRPVVSQHGYLTQTVAGVADGVTRLTTVVDSARIQLPPGFNGPRPDIAGMRFMTTLDARGRVLSSEVDRSTVPTGLQGFESQFEQLFAAMSFEFPEEAISPGTSWTNSVDETVPGPVGPMATSNQGRYTLDRVDVTGGKRLAVISLAGTVSQRSVNDPERPAMMNVDVAGDVEGRFVIDLDTGRLVTMENSTTLEGQVRMGNSVDGIPLRITSRTSIELLGR